MLSFLVSKLLFSTFGSTYCLGNNAQKCKSFFVNSLSHCLFRLETKQWTGWQSNCARCLFVFLFNQPPLINPTTRTSSRFPLRHHGVIFGYWDTLGLSINHIQIMSTVWSKLTGTTLPSWLFLVTSSIDIIILSCWCFCSLIVLCLQPHKQQQWLGEKCRNFEIRLHHQTHNWLLSFRADKIKIEDLTWCFGVFFRTS